MNNTVKQHLFRASLMAALLLTTATAPAGVVVTGSVYGGGNVADVSGNTEVNVTGGTVSTDVYGGGYGQTTNVTGNVTVNIGSTSGTGTETTYSGTADIAGDVYGGSALGTVNSSTSNTTTVNLYSGTIHGDAYGGGLGQIEREAAEGVKPLADIKAIVNGNVVVNQYGVKYEIKKIKENADATDEIVSSGRIFGCNNLNGTPLGSVYVNVYGSKSYSGERGIGKFEIAAVYGGGNLAAYKPYGPAANNTSEDYKATIRQAHVTISGCSEVSIEQVYGGGNAASTPSTLVDIEGCFEINEVFGGGNGKDRIQKNGVWYDNPGANVGFYEYLDNVAGQTDTKENRAANYGYGTGAANVNINGGLINYVFGGSNTKGNVRITAVTMLEDKASCDFFTIGEAYGGGKSAPMDAEAKLLMSCIPGLRAAYGGAEAADVQGGVKLSITNGKFDRVFGGNNISGTIGGPIEVNIEETGCKPIIIGELYGGGNLAGYSVYGYDSEKRPVETGTTKLYADPVVNVKSFTSIGDIYGGGYGASAKMVGDPHVNINVVKGDKASVTDAVLGDNVTTEGGYPVPSHESGAIGAINNVYGGGNAAPVVGSTYVKIGTEQTVDYVTKSEGETEARTGIKVVGADIRGNVYGGGNQAEVTGSTNVSIGASNE